MEHVKAAEEWRYLKEYIYGDRVVYKGVEYFARRKCIAEYPGFDISNSSWVLAESDW